MVTKETRNKVQKRVSCLTVLLLLFMAATVTAEAKSISQDFQISVLIPETVAFVNASEEKTNKQNFEATTEEIVRNNTPIVLKTIVCK